MKYTTYNIRRLLTLIITFAAVNASAATRSITGSDGLGDLLVNAICKDYSGYIWLGTGSTLDRFDGNTVRSYSIPGDDPLLKRINCIASTPDGTCCGSPPAPTAPSISLPPRLHLPSTTSAPTPAGASTWPQPTACISTTPPTAACDAS